jgi:hypothetical protein
MRRAGVKSVRIGQSRWGQIAASSDGKSGALFLVVLPVDSRGYGHA